MGGQAHHGIAMTVIRTSTGTSQELALSDGQMTTAAGSLQFGTATEYVGGSPIPGADTEFYRTGNGMQEVYTPSAAPVDFDWSEIDMTAGSEGQWVGYSDGGDTRPQPAFGSISAQPSPATSLLALYDDTASGIVLAVFSGDYATEMDGIQMAIGGFVLNSFETELISGNTWVRFSGQPGDWSDGDVYQIEFGFDL